MKERRDGRRSLRAVAVNVGLVAISCVIALIVAEGLVRIVALQQLILIRPDIWQPADTVGWLHRPHVSTRVNTGERTVNFFTDRDGFRVGQSGRTEARKRVLLIGDSFMAALQVEYEQSLAGRLEADLPKRLGEGVAVRNSAVGGWGPNQYLIRARQLLPGEGYDVVLVAVYVDNDAVTDRVEYIPPRAPVQRNRFRIPRSLKWREFVVAVLSPINDMLEVRSHLFVLVRSRMQTVRMRLGLIPPYFPVAILRRQASSERWAVTAELCRDIADLASVHGTPTLFFLIPAPYQVDSDALDRHVRGFALDPAQIDIEQPSRLLAGALRAQGLSVIDALPAFRAAHTSGRRLYGNVDEHLSPAGHEALNALLMPRVVEMLRAPTAVGISGQRSAEREAP